MVLIPSSAFSRHLYELDQHPSTLKIIEVDRNECLPVRRSLTTWDAKAAAAALLCSDVGSIVAAASHGNGAARAGTAVPPAPEGAPRVGGGGGLCAGTRITPAAVLYTSPAAARAAVGRPADTGHKPPEVFVRTPEVVPLNCTIAG